MATTGGWTVRLIDVLPVRDCASVMLIARLFGPGVVLAATVAWNENILSIAVVSPCVPSSKNCWAADPPMAARLPVTARPVLVGLAPGVTATVSSVELPGGTELGLAA